MSSAPSAESLRRPRPRASKRGLGHRRASRNPAPLEGLEQLATISEDKASELARLDRHERRALSRLKLVVRDFDAHVHLSWAIERTILPVSSNRSLGLILAERSHSGVRAPTPRLDLAGSTEWRRSFPSFRSLRLHEDLPLDAQIPRNEVPPSPPPGARATTAA